MRWVWRWGRGLVQRPGFAGSAARGHCGALARAAQPLNTPRTHAALDRTLLGARAGTQPLRGGVQRGAECSWLTMMVGLLQSETKRLNARVDFGWTHIRVHQHRVVWVTAAVEAQQR